MSNTTRTSHGTHVSMIHTSAASAMRDSTIISTSKTSSAAATTTATTTRRGGCYFAMVATTIIICLSHLHLANGLNSSRNNSSVLSVIPGPLNGYQMYLGDDLFAANGSLAISINNTWYHATGDDINRLVMLGRNLANGRDALGSFHAFIIQWGIDSSGPTILETSIRTYNGGSHVVFEQSFPQGLKNSKNDDGEFPVCQFPSFEYGTGILDKLGVAQWNGVQGSVDFGVTKRNPQSYGCTHPMQPAALVTSDGRSVAVAPLTHHAITNCHVGAEDNSWKMGVSDGIPSYPPLFAHSTLFVASDSVTASLFALGNLTRTYYGTDREAAKAADKTLTYLGAWTDNGGFYNMNKWVGNKNLHYNPNLPASSPQTLLNNWLTKLKADGIPISYIQLDDWYYGGYIGRSGAVSCVNDWKDARKDWFPDGLEHFGSKHNISLMLYIPWICSTAVYGKEQGGPFTLVSETPMLGGYPGPTAPPGYPYGDCPWPDKLSCSFAKAQPAPEESYNFYKLLLGQGVAVGMTNFEQDFVAQNSRSYGWGSCLNCTHQWLSGMNAAARELKVPVQYCLSDGATLLASGKFDWVTQARASGDYAGCGGWDIGLTGMLHWVMDVAPFHDVLWTTAFQPGDPYTNTTMDDQQYRHCLHSPSYGQPNVVLDVIVASFSRAPVGIGDGLGYTNKSLIMRTCRQDGALLRSEKLMTPLDKTFYQVDNKWYNRPILSSYSDVEGNDASRRQVRHHYVLVIGVNESETFTVTLAEDVYPKAQDGEEFVVYKAGTPCDSSSSTAATAGVSSPCLKKVNSSDALPLWSTPPTAFQPLTSETLNFSLYTFAPVDKLTGWAIIGEMDKFVSHSPVRFTGPPSHATAGDAGDVGDTGSCVHLSLAGTLGETVTLLAMAPSGSIVTEAFVLSAQHSTIMLCE